MFERSPDLKIGVTLPFFQIWEKVELTRDRLNIWVSDGAMTAAASFTTHFTDIILTDDIFTFALTIYLMTT
jgi:hypothetical protein